MLQSIQNGACLIEGSIRVFNHHPKFLVPLLLTWVVYAPLILYLQYGVHWDAHTTPEVLFIILGTTFTFAFLLSFSCLMLLELIQQLESGQKMSVTKAFVHTLSHNIVRTLPIIFVWTIVWFILSIIEAIFSRSSQGGKESLSVEGAAKTLSGYREISLSSVFFESLQKGFRMIVFLILPAIAWENLGFRQSIKKGLAVLRGNLSVFVTGFVLTWLAAAVIFMPPALLFILSDDFGVVFPTWVWVVTIIYIAFGWSYSMYLEQMFTAELYLWHCKWEKEVAKAQQEGRPIPTLSQVPRPSVLDDVHELIDKSFMTTPLRR